MSNVSKQIYRKINGLFPDLHTIKPFTKLDLKERGYDNIHLVMLESNPGEFNFILSRYENERGQLIANPSIEILVNPNKKVANAVTYKDCHYFHSAVPEPHNIGEIALCQANGFLYNFLSEINNLHRNFKKTNPRSVSANSLNTVKELL